MAADHDLGPLGGNSASGAAGAERPAPASLHKPAPRARARSSGGGFISKLVLAAMLLAAMAFFLAPWFALWAVRSAAQSRDNAALSDLVDVGAVRAGLREQLAAAPPPPPIDPWKHPLEAMRQALEAHTPLGPDVEGYLTPAALDDLLNGRAPGEPIAAHPWPILRYWGFDRCRLAVRDPANPRRETLLTFQRHGWYAWKLSRIGLPG